MRVCGVEYLITGIEISLETASVWLLVERSRISRSLSTKYLRSAERRTGFARNI